MQNIQNNIFTEEQYLDEKIFETFPTEIDYKAIFEAVATHKITPTERKQIYRELCRSDLYFLLRYAMNREDMNNEWLYQRCKEVELYNNKVVHLWSRGHYKSTIGTLAKSIQDILINPNDTMCIFSVTDTIANPFLRQISTELNDNNFLRRLFPEIIPEEGSDMLGMEKLTVKRDSRKKEATIESSGVITKMPTSRHYDIVIYDDLVTPETVNDGVLEQTYERFRMSLNCVATKYKIRIFGTPYHYQDVYAQIKQLGLYDVIEHPCYDRVTGEPVFMTKESLEEKRLIMGDRVFNSQMRLDPTPTDEAFFRTDAIITEDIIPEYDRINRKMMVILDPAISKKKTSDYCVCMVIETFQYADNIHSDIPLQYIQVHEYFHIKEGNKNPTRILNVLVDFCLKYNVNRPIIETVAYQESLIYRLKEICAERNLRLYPDEFKPTTNKEARISSLDPIVNLGRLIIKPEMKEIIDQFKFYPHFNDDHIDCIATSLLRSNAIFHDMKPINNIDRFENGEYNSVKRVINNYNRTLNQDRMVDNNVQYVQKWYNKKTNKSFGRTGRSPFSRV